MSRVSSPLVLLALLLAAPAARAAVTACPATSHGTALRNASVFDGPPEDEADLVPDRINTSNGSRLSARLSEEWDVAYLFALHGHLFVRCDYAPGTPSVVIEPPATTTLCALTVRSDNTAAFTCKVR